MLGVAVLNVAFIYCYAEIHYAEFRYDKCRYDKCRYTECRGASELALVTSVRKH